MIIPFLSLYFTNHQYKTVTVCEAPTTDYPPARDWQRRDLLQAAATLHNLAGSSAAAALHSLAGSSAAAALHSLVGSSAAALHSLAGNSAATALPITDWQHTQLHFAVGRSLD